MKQRCYNPKNPKYPRYGGRGITVCDRWLGDNGFHNFVEDMGEALENLSLDRENNDLGYFKDNCRWVDRLTQSNNIGTNHLVTYKGKTQSISLWARELNIQRQAVWYRINAGWSVERTFETACKGFSY